MLLVNTDFITGKELETLGIVKGNVVQCRNVGRDFMAGIKTLVGGELKEYTEMLNQARQIAIKRMVDEAETNGSGCHHQYPLRVFLHHAGRGGSDRLRDSGEI